MSDDHLTSEAECPDCTGFNRCDYHEGIRHGRQEAEAAIRTGTVEAVNEILAEVDDDQGYRKAMMGLADEIGDAIMVELGTRRDQVTAETEDDTDG
jgi:hypothetical protein